ncbi:helix-turn-helix transcriptional regulator [Nocardia sp. CDC186]|uniref:Helix-turn-helix transcriptional regulator n=1 Tax=Nocardia implantans TaxID=3108168 RepID=A0ABU6B1A8_9NOCA|nr:MULTISPECIES: helix-turn-helix transcriptional regulator [unclassified Nocardia]MBF6195661.1 helix-turn-helix transcriptional regulator [Nocardia beijingensis]MEA3531253.1 helix-turn-helix transcriptional regulator [Nocardia sp. CDC192]MEB3513537.1 helix-turn-helix transcriptional regulator [Nocardia sp. CDC186]
MANADEFDQVRRDPDPIRRGRRATDLMTVYQQRGAELARLRREALEEAHQTTGLSYTDLAAQIGITKSRVSQIRKSAPPPERAFFGVGPVAIGIPHRMGFEDGRERPFLDESDEAVRDRLNADLERLSFSTSRFAIRPDTESLPDGDSIVVCGPKSAPVARRLLEADTNLSFEHNSDGWWIIDAQTGLRHGSPYRQDSARRSDVGYLSRRIEDNRVIVHIAGITAIGSLGVAHWLTAHLTDVYSPKDTFISCAIACDFESETVITDSRLIAGPYRIER